MGHQRQAAPEVVTGGGRALSSALVQARQSGHCKLRGRGLSALPQEVCDISVVSLPEGGKWWETVEFLVTIDASQNELTTLPNHFGLPGPPDHFGRPEPSPLAQLRELNLNHNRLAALPPAGCWRELVSLVNLDIGHNGLTCLPDGFGADNLPPLVRLDATHNSLSSLPWSLGGLRGLVEMDASHNELSVLPSGLSGLASLKKLQLNRNLLSELPLDFLQRPPPLVEVELAENRLQALALGVPSVHSLNLANNKLQMLDLAGCHALQELSAPYNAFRSLPSGLPTLPSLATLDLGNNKIEAIVPLCTCASLTRIDMSNNEIKEVPPHLGTLSLNRLALSGNPLRTMPSAILNGPTPKLLSHLRGKCAPARARTTGHAACRRAACRAACRPRCAPLRPLERRPTTCERCAHLGHRRAATAPSDRG